MRVLSRTWQMLLKGYEEVRTSPRPLAAADMVLVRLAYAADLPTPDEAIRMMTPDAGTSSPSAASSARASVASPSPSPRAALSPRGGEAAAARVPVAAVQMAPRAEATPVRRLNTFAEVVALAGEKRDLVIKTALESDIRFVAMEDGRLEIALERSAARAVVNDLARKLELWTGRRWAVIVSNAPGEPTLRAQAEAARDQLEDDAKAHPYVQAVMARWPGTVVGEVRRVVHELPADGADAVGDGADEMPDEDD
jgi:DNA polymerase-3 subunit gamma/tau